MTTAMERLAHKLDTHHDGNPAHGGTHKLPNSKLRSFLKRLPSKHVHAIRDLADSEIKSREHKPAGKPMSEMTRSEFEKYTNNLIEGGSEDETHG